MDELYRGYRISITRGDRWDARITHVRGPLMPLDAHATVAEGPKMCLARARGMIDRYVTFLNENGINDEPH